MNDSQIVGVLTPILGQFGLELEAVEIIPAGKRRLLRVVVDGDGPEGRAASGRHRRGEQGAVGGPGQLRCGGHRRVHAGGELPRGEPPLELPRHWRRNAGRLVVVSLAEGTPSPAGSLKRMRKPCGSRSMERRASWPSGQ